ncbi:MAG: AMP-binding protein [Halapricum sp.]
MSSNLVTGSLELVSEVQFSPVFLQFYGQMEVANLITTFGKLEHRTAVERGRTERLTSPGQTCLMADVRIVGVETGETQPPGEEGEILATAPYVMEEYFERSERWPRP